MDLSFKFSDRTELAESASADGASIPLQDLGIYLMHEAFEAHKFWRKGPKNESNLNALGFPQLELDF